MIQIFQIYTTLYGWETKRPRIDISIHRKTAIIYYYYGIKWYIEAVKTFAGNINSDHIVYTSTHTYCITNLFAYNIRQFPYKVLYFVTEQWVHYNIIEFVCVMGPSTIPHWQIANTLQCKRFALLVDCGV